MSAVTVALIALWMVLQVLDIATTERVLRRGGREANPVMAWLMRQLGRPGAYAVKILISVGVAYCLARMAPGALILTNAVLAWVCWHNWRIGQK